METATLDRFGKYHVLSRIAQGGMAEVYKVKTVGIAGFEKIQALKRIRPHFAREPRFIRSFIDEARIVEKLSHRNIVQVFDFGKVGGELYLAMELIDGVDLRTAMADARGRGNPLTIPLACYILGEIGAGLDYAHRKTDSQGESLGIVHCDVSPPNVMLSYEGYVKVLDFGVARARFSAQQSKRRLRGKPRYMAPEQTRGDIPTAATDVFALGIIAWEMLTGLALFEGHDIPAILEAVRRVDAPPADRLNPDVPAVVAAAVSQALSPRPADRGTSGDFAQVMSTAAQLFTPRAHSRSLSRWLAQVYPELSAGHRPTIQPPRQPEPRVSVTLDADPTTPETERPAVIPPVTITVTSELSHSSLEPAATRTLDTSEHQLAAASSTAIEMVDSVDDAEPLELREKRRVVAIAVLVDRVALPHGPGDVTGDGDGQAIIQMLGDLAYKRGAVVHSQDASSLLAVFGLEVAGEDDVAAAMGYALAAVETAREGHLSGDGEFALRIAARAGIVAAPDDHGGYRLVGDAIDETRELARGAEPGRPLLSGGTGRLASTHYAFRELPARRHRRRRLRVLELLGPRSYDERTRSLHLRRQGRFFGRQGELARLGHTLARSVEESRLMVVAVVGPTGAGKSRLIAEFVAQARASAAPGHEPELVAVAASPDSKMAPFSTVIELAQASLNLPPGRGEAARSQLAQRTRHVLTRAGIDTIDAAELAHAVELGMALRDGAPVDPNEQWSDLRERLAGALHAVRRALGSPDRPLVWVVEDLHFADAGSLEILRRSGPILGDRPELVVYTGTGDKLADDLADWVDEVVTLGELAADELSQLIRDRLGAGATDDAISTIAERAGGNPLLVEELAVEARDAGAIPPTARALIIARVDRLNPLSKGVLQRAAVIGRRFRAPILEELVGRDISEELQDLCDEHLLSRDDGSARGGHEGALAFTRGLICEVVYESLSAGARRETHAVLGDLLAARYRAGRDEPPATIAEHYERGGKRSAASAFWLRAGRVSLAASDAAAASEWFTRTITLEERRDEAARSPASRARLREAIAGRELAYRQLGQHDAQAGDLARLERMAGTDPAQLADVKNRSAIRWLRLGDYHAAVTTAEEAERAARRAGDAHHLGESLRIRGEAYERAGDFERGLAMTRQAQQIFEEIGDRAAETKALIGIARTYVVQNRYPEAQVEYDAIVARVQQSGDPWLERVVLNHMAVIHLCLGEFEQAMESITRAIDICQRYGDHAREGDNLSVGGTILTELGCPQDARAYFTRALAILGHTDSRWSRADCLVYAGVCEARLGEYDRGLAYLDESIETARAIGAPYVEANALVAMSSALLARAIDPDVENACDCAAEAAAVARRATLTGQEILALSRQAQATFRTGDLDGAVELSTRAIELFDHHPYIEGPEEEILYTHYLLLSATEDPTACAVLARARTSLERKLAALKTPAWRQSFTENVSVNAAILAE